MRSLFDARIKAQGFVQNFTALVHPEMRTTIVECVEELIYQEREEGARWMRERAVEIVHRGLPAHPHFRDGLIMELNKYPVTREECGLLDGNTMFCGACGKEIESGGSVLVVRGEMLHGGCYTEEGN